MKAMNINTRKYTYNNISGAEMVMALDGLQMHQARIYAAAPEMLAALTDLVLDWDAAAYPRDKQHDKLIEKARKVITQA